MYHVTWWVNPFVATPFGYEHRMSYTDIPMINLCVVVHLEIYTYFTPGMFAASDTSRLVIYASELMVIV